MLRWLWLLDFYLLSCSTGRLFLMNKRKQKQILREYKKKTVYPFLARMYKLMAEEPDLIILKKLPHNTHGICDFDNIYLDYRRDLVSTLIHEFIHYMYPDWSETKVLREESRIVNALSVSQVKNILKKYAETF